MGGRGPARVEAAGDLAQALAFRMFCLNAKHELVRDGGGSSRRCRLRVPSCGPASLFHKPLEFVNRNELRPPRHVDGLEERQHPPAEGRSTYPERLGSLRPGVGESLDLCRLANDGYDRTRSSGRGWRVPFRFLGLPLMPAGHAYKRTRTVTVLHFECICVSLAIEVGSCCTWKLRSMASFRPM